MRPASIVQFERLFLGALALDTISNVLSRDAMVALTKTYPQLAASAPTVVSCIIAGEVVIGLLIWFFAAHRASPAAKWIAGGWFVVSTMLLALSVFGGISFTLATVLGWAAYVVRAWSVSYLFKPDAEAWFAKPE